MSIAVDHVQIILFQNKIVYHQTPALSGDADRAGSCAALSLKEPTQSEEPLTLSLQQGQLAE